MSRCTFWCSPHDARPRPPLHDAFERLRVPLRLVDVLGLLRAFVDGEHKQPV